jgi:hypothetical protein
MYETPKLAEELLLLYYLEPLGEILCEQLVDLCGKASDIVGCC